MDVDWSKFVVTPEMKARAERLEAQMAHAPGAFTPWDEKSQAELDADWAMVEDAQQRHLAANPAQ